MKKTLTLICFSCFWLFATASEKPTGILCEDEIGVIQNLYQINFGDTINTGISSEEPLSISWNVFPKTGLITGLSNCKKSKLMVDNILTFKSEYSKILLKSITSCFDGIRYCQ